VGVPARLPRHRPVHDARLHRAGAARPPQAGGGTARGARRHGPRRGAGGAGSAHGADVAVQPGPRGPGEELAVPAGEALLVLRLRGVPRLRPQSHRRPRAVGAMTNRPRVQLESHGLAPLIVGIVSTGRNRKPLLLAPPGVGAVVRHHGASPGPPGPAAREIKGPATPAGSRSPAAAPRTAAVGRLAGPAAPTRAGRPGTPPPAPRPPWASRTNNSPQSSSTDCGCPGWPCQPRPTARPRGRPWSAACRACTDRP